MDTNYEYEELRSLGLPEIPRSYQLKFKIKSRAKSASSGREHRNVVCVQVSKVIFGIPIPWKWAFMSREERSNRYCPDIAFLLENNYLTEKQFASQQWYPAHLAVAGRYAFNTYITEDLRKKERARHERAVKKKQKLEGLNDDLTNIKHLLRKGMP
jgi:hypothetical protein